MRLTLLIASLGLGLVAGAAQAQDRAVMTPDELDSHRGGYLTAGGVTLNFGAVVRTYIGGELALESRLTWTEQGAVTDRLLGSIPGLVDLDAALDIALAQGLDLRGLGEGRGLLLSDADGATAVFQSFDGSVRNLIVNNADGRDFRQEIELTLTLPDLTTMQRDFGVERFGSQLTSDIQLGLGR